MSELSPLSHVIKHELMNDALSEGEPLSMFAFVWPIAVLLRR